MIDMEESAIFRDEIDGFWLDQPLTTMVLQWFFPILGTNGSQWSNFGDQWFTMVTN